MGKEPKRRMGWKGLLFLAAIVFVILGIGCLSIERILLSKKRSIAILNCHSIARSLSDFKTEFGDYPCPETRELLVKRGIKKVPAGTDANSYLAQLIVTKMIDSETNFYCEIGKGYHRPDDRTSTLNEILAPGENIYAYVMAQDNRPLTQVKNASPLVIAPIMSGGSNPTFDREPLDRYFVYGAVDGSTRSGRIGTFGEAKSKGRNHLFQSGKDSLFGDQIPDVKIPTRKY